MRLTKAHIAFYESVGELIAFVEIMHSLIRQQREDTKPELNVALAAFALVDKGIFRSVDYIRNIWMDDEPLVKSAEDKPTKALITAIEMGFNAIADFKKRAPTTFSARTLQRVIVQYLHSAHTYDPEKFASDYEEEANKKE